jgi:dihydroxyacetone kinase
MVGDGDCESTLAQGAAAVLDSLKTMPLDSPRGADMHVANTVGRSMGGTSGGIYRIFCAAAAKALPQDATWTFTNTTAAMAAGIQAVTKYGGAGEGGRTMVDALAPAAAALAAPGGTADAAAAAARAGAAATAHMVAGAGRSTYVPAAVSEGVEDPGAAGVGIWMSAVAGELAVK